MPHKEPHWVEQRFADAFPKVRDNESDDDGDVRTGPPLASLVLDRDQLRNLDPATVSQITCANKPIDAMVGTWEPVDLRQYLDGSVQRVQPSLGISRTDGLRLLYPGKEHIVIGETECGKSWFALGCAKAELDANNHVVYVHFEESDPTDTVTRLQEMGASKADIVGKFHFFAPESRITMIGLIQLIELYPSLVILDGVNEAMAMHGWDIRDEMGAAAFRRYLTRPFNDLDIATLAADHVVKDREKRGRTPLGSIHKLNGLSGAAYLLENKDPFGQGKCGASRLYTTKDRPGAIRKHGIPDKSIPGKTYIGMFIVDSVEASEFNPQHLDYRITPPDPENTDKPDDDPNRDKDAKILDVVKRLRETGEGPFSTRTVRAVANMSKEAVADSLERLTTSGRVTRSSGPNRANLWDLAE